MNRKELTLNGILSAHYNRIKPVSLQNILIGCKRLIEQKIADRLNEQRPTNKAPLNVLIQINISDEESKSGIQPEEMLTLAKHIENLPHLCLRGLMAIPAPTDNIAEQENAFRKMLELFEQLKQVLPNQQIDTLSMGMTDDMPSAIKCGSTMVRIGTAILVREIIQHHKINNHGIRPEFKTSLIS